MNYFFEKKEKEEENTILMLIQILIGAFIMAFGVSQFLLPNQLSSGGFTGIATVTYYLLKLPVGATVIALNIPLFIMSFIRKGKEFLIRGIIGTVSLSVFIDILDKFEPLTEDRFLACIYGGIIVGLGTSIILKANASTGGTDMMAYVIKTYKPMYRTSNLIMMSDIIIVLVNMLFFKEIEIGLYSAITIYLMGKIIDIVFEGVYFTKMMFIVSNKYEEIAKTIGEKVQRGTTAIYAKGMYTNEDKMLLWCVASRNEAMRIKQISKRIDPNAFIVISNAREAFGIGFKKG